MMIRVLPTKMEEKIALWRKEHPLPLFLTYPFFKIFSWHLRNKFLNFDPKKRIFEAVNIQTQAKCNYNCSFCPNNKIKRPQGTMKKELFKKIIEELSELNYSNEIRLYLMNEPFIDRRMVNFIKMIECSCPDAKIIIETNGSLLTEELLQRVLKTSTKIIVNDYTGGKIIDKVKSMGFDLTKNILLRKRSNEEILSNRAGNIYQPVKSPLKLFCERPFNHLYIGFDGRAPLCCQDWKFEEVMGDVNKKSIKGVWCDKKYEKKRKDLLEFKRTGLCEKCDWRGFSSLKGKLGKWSE